MLRFRFPLVHLGGQIMLCTILYIAFPMTMQAHKEPTHQYIIREAYALLKHHLGRSIPEFDEHLLGLDSLGNEGEFHDISQFPWQYTTIPGGAWSEDVYDPVRNMHDSPFPFIDGTLTSITHFWDPDNCANGFNNNFTLHLPWNPWPTGFFETNFCSLARTYLPNYHYDLMAFRKAMIYLSSQHYQPKLTEFYTFNFNGIEFKSPGFYGHSLIDWHNNVFTYNNQQLEEHKLDIIYSVIGRIAHLLGDMSIPAHVKCDEHGIWHDPYEDAMNYKEWNGNKMSPCIDAQQNIPSAKERVEYWHAHKVFSEKGSFIDKECSYHPENPLWGLFYSTAQIADHFASNRFNGDDYYLEVGEISSVILEDVNALHPGPTQTVFIDGNPDLSGYARKEKDILAIRDITFPYVIRATAGLLYFVAKEFRLLGNAECPKNISIIDAQLSAPSYRFSASDTIQAGDESKPLHITKNVQFMTLQAEHVIRLNPGLFAEQGSNVHACINACTTCSDNNNKPIKQMQQKETLIDYPLPDFTILDIKSEQYYKNNGSCGMNCCDDIGIVSCSISTPLQKNINKLIDEHGGLTELEADAFILHQEPGLYFMEIERSNGIKEQRIINRL